MKTKKRSSIYIILIAVLLLAQQFISGCATTVTKDLHKENLYKIEVDPISQKLFNIKCSLCHELPDIDAYPYTPEQWSSIIDIMHDTKASKKFMTIEDTDKIKVYLKNMSQTK